MKTLKNSLLIGSLIVGLTGSAQELDWAKSMGGSTSDQGYSIDVDASGNVYTTGFFTGTADFDPGLGVYNLVSMGVQDIFISKQDALGNLLWARSFGSAENDYGHSIAVDAAGNVYTTGYFKQTVDFDPGSGTYDLTSLGGSDIFISKLDASGNFVWAKRIGGTSPAGPDVAYSLVLDASANIFITGSFTGTVDFDPGSGVYNLTTPALGIFVCKLDVSGDLVWAKGLNGTSYCYGYDITLDAAGNVYTTGKFQATVDFDPGAGTYNIVGASSIVNDAFVSKLDASGNFVWAKAFIGGGEQYGNSIVVDGSGNVYTTGLFEQSADFDPGAGTYNMTITGSSGDMFLSKLDAAGNFVWAKKFGSLGQDNAHSMFMDAAGDLYITGYYSGTGDFDPGSGTFNLTSVGSADIFISKLDDDGNHIWAKSMGSLGWDEGYEITLDAADNIYTTGYFAVTADFDPGIGVSNLTSAGGSDIFVQKLSNCLSETHTDAITACDSYMWIDGVTYTSSNNTATYVLTNTAGCDSTVTLNLIITNSNSATDVITACDSYTWIDGVTYTSSNNTATHVLTNTAGCDSTVTLNLTLTNSNSGTDVITACDSYTWIDGITYTSSNSTATHTLINTAGCDSTVTLNLTITNSNTGMDVITACDSYTWIDGITYTSSNSTATHTLINTAGCDSTVTLNLTITNSNTETDVITACDSYTWIDGVTYTSSNNTATHTLTNVGGCDSIVTLNLTLTNSNTGTDVITACDSYTWIDGVTYTSSNNTATHTLTNTAGCDSVVTLNLTINNTSNGIDVIESCDSYTWIDGVTYTLSNNTATHVLTNSLGCDSVVTLNLTINNAPNMTASDSGSGTITASAASSYQWIDCTTDLELSGETNATFSPLVNGTYAVIGYSAELCADTSDCVVIDYLGNDEWNNFALTIAPNPAGSFVTITFEATSATLIIYNAQGKPVAQKIIESNAQVSLEDLSSGIYFFELMTPQGRTVKRIMKI